MRYFDSEFQASEFLSTFKCLRRDTWWCYREIIELHNKYLIDFEVRLVNTVDINWHLETYVWQFKVPFQEFLSLIPPEAVQEFLFHLDVFI